MTFTAPEVFAFFFIAAAIIGLRLWIARQPDVAAARTRVRTTALWIVAILALVLSAAGLLIPALRPNSPVGFFVAFGAIYLLVLGQRGARRAGSPAARS